MEQFSLEKYLENPSRKVVTERNKEVRIICTDINCAYPIIAAIKINDDRETPLSYDINGKCPFYEGNDLLFADEKEELTEFELRLLSSLYYIRKFRRDFSNADMTKIIKDVTKELLDLARKELEKNYRLVDKDDSNWEDGYKQGKADTLKDLPKWKKATEHKEFAVHVCVMDEYMFPYLDTEVNEGEYYIELSDLKTLPKEE